MGHKISANGDWWVTGGYNSNDGYLASTEILSESSFAPYADMPVPRGYHNLVNMDEDRVMLLGGQARYVETFIYDANNGTWSNGPNLKSGRYSSQAGLVTFTNGSKAVMVAGGFPHIRTSEYLMLDGDGDSWTFGPLLPIDICDGASVQLDKSFLIVGGNNGTYQDTIWMFDTAINDWTLLEQRLTIARSHSSSFMVPDNFC